MRLVTHSRGEQTKGQPGAMATGAGHGHLCLHADVGARWPCSGPVQTRAKRKATHALGHAVGEASREQAMQVHYGAVG